METKKTFIRYVSHEIRNPLNSVLLGLKVLRDIILTYPDNHDAMETWFDVKESADIVLITLNDTLLFDKIEDSTLKLELEKESVASIVHTTIKTFSLQVI